jgi:hypothetical protein
MAMTRRVSVTLDASSDAAMNRIMQHTGWNKSQVLREAIKAAAKSEGLARRLASNRRTKARAKG